MEAIWRGGGGDTGVERETSQVVEECSGDVVTTEWGTFQDLKFEIRICTYAYTHRV